MRLRLVATVKADGSGCEGQKLIPQAPDVRTMNTGKFLCIHTTFVIGSRVAYVAAADVCE